MRLARITKSAAWLVSLASPESATAIIAGLIGWFAAFVFGIRLEQVASQLAIYRMVRTVGR